MNFNKHSELSGLHAFLSASKYHWVNYEDEKLDETFLNAMAARRGDELHAFGAEAIRLGIRLQETEQTLNMYVNDAIRFRMQPEQILFYSPNCFGTADAISFRDNKLRIHDLKTGITPVKMTQLEIYVALFCLEYDVRPDSIDIELRIYQNDEVIEHVPDLMDIVAIMSKIKTFDQRIENLRAGMR